MCNYTRTDQEQDRDQEGDAAESRVREQTVVRPTRAVIEQEIRRRRPTWADLDGWRRDKREIEDRTRLASRREAARALARANNQNEEEFAIDDGDEDAWVHDGIDDIQIDPETKKAASELSSSWSDDGNTIDSEYEPNHQQQQQLVNRTRVTTISEVIPTSAAAAAAGHDSGFADSTSLSSRYVSRPQQRYLPAALLSLSQASRLVEKAAAAAQQGRRSTSSDSSSEAGW